MKNYWFISDTHFNHSNFLAFKRDDGTPCRDFDSIKEMNELIIENWNKAIKPQDKVYHLGDVIMGDPKKYDKILSRLNGKKRLVIGNHDIEKLKHISKYFQKISGARDLNINGFKCIISHIPLHPSCLERFGVNIHGHIHDRILGRKEFKIQPRPLKILETVIIPQPNYLNVCVERTDYKPINLEEIIDK